MTPISRGKLLLVPLVCGISLCGCRSPAEFFRPGLERIGLLSRASPTPPPARAASPRKLELLKEMMTVVSLSAPDEKEFRGWASVLLQGASLEGVYNGLTHSERQRERERGTPATARALSAFARELALLQADLPRDTPFTRRDSAPLPPPEDLRYEEAAPDPSRDAESAAADPAPVRLRQREIDVPALARRYEELFSGASLFTLKRVLGDEILKVIERLEHSRPLLSEWYGEMAARLGAEGVDFGLPKRNLRDAEFHRKWAQQEGNSDFLRWESLNRAHRLLNARNALESR